MKEHPIFHEGLVRVVWEETYRIETEPIIGEVREFVDGCPVDYWVTASGKYNKGDARVINTKFGL